MSKRRLPVLTERSISEVRTLQLDLSTKFERQVRTEVSSEGLAITCRSGCASCCYHPIQISVLEGVLLYRWLTANGRYTSELKKRLQETADQQYGVSYEVWLLSLTPCPLLDKGSQTCTAYEARPFICRSYYATSDPYYCHPHRLGESTQIIPRDEVVTKFHESQKRILKSHQISMQVVPIGTAILLGEKICQGDIDLESVDHVMIKEYLEKG